MVERPDDLLDRYLEAGCGVIIVHAETATHLHRTLGHIRSAGASPAVALNPATPVDGLRHVLDLLDMVLVMTVNPGFGGQSYIASMEAKIAEVRALVVESRLRHRHRGGRRHRSLHRRRRSCRGRQRARGRVGAVPRRGRPGARRVRPARPRRGGRRSLRRRLAAARRPPRGPRRRAGGVLGRRRQPGELLRPVCPRPPTSPTWSGTSTRPSPSSSTTGSRTRPTSYGDLQRRRPPTTSATTSDASPRRSRGSSRSCASTSRTVTALRAELASRKAELLGAGPSAQRVVDYARDECGIDLGS